MGYFEAPFFLEHLDSTHHNPGVLCLCLEFENPSWHMFQEGNLKIKVGKKKWEPGDMGVEYMLRRLGRTQRRVSL